MAAGAEKTPLGKEDTTALARDKLSDVADSSSGEKRNKTARMAVKDVDADPPARRKLLFDEAHRLATMPRQKREEFTQSAFWSAIATGTSGLAGLYDILSDKPVQPKMLDLSEILIFAICVALVIVGNRKLGRVETAEEYLNRLYNVSKTPGAVTKK